MIENTLLHSILDTIFKQIERPWQVPQDNSRFDLLRELLKIKKWGSLQKDKVITQMSGPLGKGQMKQQKNKVHLLPQTSQSRTLINST
jgi:hypothetical protein